MKVAVYILRDIYEKHVGLSLPSHAWTFNGKDRKCEQQRRYLYYRGRKAIYNTGPLTPERVYRIYLVGIPVRR